MLFFFPDEQEVMENEGATATAAAANAASFKKDLRFMPESYNFFTYI